MPELPEVETIVRDLKIKILNLKIKKVEVLLPRIVKNQVASFKNILTANSFKSIGRFGKLIVFELEKGDKKLLVHLKMTGQLIFSDGKKVIAGGHDDGTDPNQLPNKYTRAIFEFEDKSKLFFNDLRTFGYLKLASENEVQLARDKIGPDALESNLNFQDFKNILKNRRTSIKAVLLNQEILAGIGNIYADEILFQAGVRPSRKANGLKIKEIEAIYTSIKPILKKAINYRGTTFNSFVDANGNQGKFVDRLKVYGREGKKCQICQGDIKKIKVAQRGTHYCASCQK
jgi:formamidopyrimidine-DNA glycosylase